MTSDVLSGAIGMMCALFYSMCVTPGVGCMSLRSKTLAYHRLFIIMVRQVPQITTTMRAMMRNSAINRAIIQHFNDRQLLRI